MKIAVCVKQIPDPAARAELRPDHRLLRDGKLVMDDADSFGVEVALQIMERSDGGEVVLFSMAPRDEVSGLRSALSMGASRAVLVCDDALAGSDALSTAKVLAKAIARENFDLVIAGTESSDGYTGTMPVQLAELMGLPSVTFAKKVDLEGSLLRVARQTEAGYEEVEVPLPALITVTTGSVDPRYPSFKGIMSAKSKPVEILSIADLGIESTEVGIQGARQKIVSVRAVSERESGVVVADDGDGHLRIVEFLEQLKLI